MMAEPAPRPQKRGFGMTAAACAVFVAAMVGMSFAAVPLYRAFCQATGYNGTVRKAESAPAATLDRIVTVRFDANVGNGLGWSFRPEQREVKVKLGEVGTVRFIAENRMPTANIGAAVFNVSPDDVGAYFNKIACFCFSAQTLKAGESIRMPVVFFVDPSMVDDHELDRVDTITLSYTFFPAAAGEVPAKPVADAPAGRTGKSLLSPGDGNG